MLMLLCFYICGVKFPRGAELCLYFTHGIVSDVLIVRK